MRKPKRKELSFTKKLIISILVGVLSAVLASLLASIISVYIDFPYEYNNAVGFLISGIYMYVASYMIGRLNRKDGIKCGIIISTISIIVFLIFSFFKINFSFVIYTLVKVIYLQVIALIGSIKGVNAKIKYYWYHLR